MPDEGLESFLRELGAHLFSVVASLERAHLHTEEVIVRVRVFRRHQKDRIAPPFQDVDQCFGILFGAQRGDLQSDALPDFPGSCGGRGLLTFDRNADYRDAISIWQDTVSKRPRNSHAQNNLGEAYYEAGRPGEAPDKLMKNVAMPLADPENDGLSIWVGGKVSNARSAPKFSKLAIPFLPALLVIAGLIWLLNPRGAGASARG
jgi:hypothetical protein